MFHNWFSSKKHVVKKRLPNKSAQPSRMNNGVNFGCSWCAHPVSHAVALMDFNDSTLGSRHNRFMTIDDINP